MFNATKWGGNASADGNTYVIFRTLDKTNPFFYTLTTGNDTGTHTGRNWGTWYIYGGNFEGDVDATKDAEGWVLIDAKENIGQDRLHPVNAEPSYFGFSTGTTEEYTYYKVVVTKAYSGVQVQMNELHFGTAEEFEAIKDEYQAAAKEFDYENIVAEQRLLDEYAANINAIDDCANMEALFRTNYELEMLRDSITTSAAAYEKYMNAVGEAGAYLEENELGESDALELFTAYLYAELEPNEAFPNGSASYIIAVHELADSVVLAEVDFLESLKAVAVAAGYGKGMDISSLILNRTFQKAGETLKDEDGKNVGREAEGWNGYIYRTATDDEGVLYAAEFCNENAKFDVSQTLTNLKNGFYKVTLNAGYRPIGDLRSYNYAAMAYANDVKTFVPAIREDMATDDGRWTGIYDDKPIYACDAPGYERTDDPAVDSVVVGYVIWGCEGAAHAFAQGRYAITMVAQVTDGTLTIGVKNEGNKGNEWTAVGNFGLVYLGETEEDAKAATPTEKSALQEASDYNADRIKTLTEVYVSDVDGEHYTDAPGFAAAQRQALIANMRTVSYEAEKTIGETMQAIYETKLAYAALYDATNKVFDKWGNFDTPDADAAYEDVYDLRYKLGGGLFESAAAATEATEELYAKYPDYMEVVAYNNNVAVETSEDEAFNYSVYALGRNPSVVMGGNFYDALEEDEVIFAFEYSAPIELTASRFYVGKDADDTQAMDFEIPAAEELTQAYINLSKALQDWGFGKTDDVIRWRFATGEIVPEGEDEVLFGIRHARMITKAQMKAEGGKVLNPDTGDLNGDEKVDIADAVTVLNIMAGGQYNKAADLNGDGKVDIADFVTVLNIMAAQ